MSQYLSDLIEANSLKGILRDVININGSKLAIKLHNFNDQELYFIFKSSNTIKYFGYINPNITDEKTKELILNNNELKFYQSEDRKRAYEIGLMSIKEAKPVNIDYRAFIHIVKENNINSNLFEEMMSNFTVFNNDEKYAILNNEEIEAWGGINFICSITKNKIEPINFIWKDKDAMFNELLDKYEIRYNMK